MWKWLAIAAAAYGLLGLAATLAPEPYSPREEAQDWQEMLRGLRQEPGPGLRPGSGPPPGATPGALPGAPGTPTVPEAPPVIDFEQPQPQFTTRPQRQARVAGQPGGNHYLRWTLAPGTERFATLILPWRPAIRAANELTLRLRADRATPVTIGLREGDGSMYSVERRATRDWRELVVPIGDFRLGPRFSDENGRLDLDQVQELIIVHFTRESRRQSSAATPITIELDDIKLK